MANSSYSIADSDISDRALRALYTAEKAAYTDSAVELDLIFQVACNDRTLFPGKRIGKNADDARYIAYWVKGYFDACSNIPSKHTAGAKNSCSDPAIRAIVQTARDLTSAEAEAQERHHNLFMSAENVHGGLLEEYIAYAIRPFGWIWCRGNTLRSIDFCNSTGTVLLQIKNKYNSENSSSSAIREGTSILKWHRLGTETNKGQKQPCFRWDVLNEMIHAHRTEGDRLPPCSMSERAYRAFLLETVSRNKEIITDL